jgi:hypothetical protein
VIAVSCISAVRLKELVSVCPFEPFCGNADALAVTLRTTAACLGTDFDKERAFLSERQGKVRSDAPANNLAIGTRVRTRPREHVA